MKIQSMLRTISFATVVLCLACSVAMAQIVVTVAPEVKARMREQAAQGKATNPLSQLKVLTPRGRLGGLNRRSPEQRNQATAQSEQEGKAAASPLVYERHEKPFGLSYKELLAQWWQWGLSIPQSASPLMDATGENAFTGQRGKIWFLSGNNGGVDEREITIPADTPLFIPILTNLFFDDGTYGPVSEAEVRAYLDDFAASATTLELSINHQPLPRAAIYHVQSNVFTTAFPEHNIFAGFDIPKGIYDISLADGYFVMLKPLSVGTHVIKMRGETADFSSYVEYYICVLPPSEALIRDAKQEK